MPSAKQVLIISLIAGTLLLIIGIFQSIQEDMSSVTNIKNSPTTFDYPFAELPASPIQNLAWFEKTSRTYRLSRGLSQSHLQLNIQVNAAQSDGQSNFYLDDLQVVVTGATNGEIVNVYVGSINNGEDIYKAQYQTATVRVDSCEYIWWKRVTGFDKESYCQGNLHTLNFVVYSNSEIQQV